MSEVTVGHLVANGTLSAEMAALLWAAIEEQRSFLTVALPRLAGKSTTAQALLDLRPASVPLHHVFGDAQEMERLRRDKLGGYLVVDEFSRAPIPGYIWGPPVQRVFDTLNAGYALQTSLHAANVEEAMLQVTRGNGISDEQAGAIKLIVYIERFGDTMDRFWRRVVEVFEVDRVVDGRPLGRPLFRWRREDDSFEPVEGPLSVGSAAGRLEERAAVIQELVGDGRLGREEVRRAVERFSAGDEKK